MKRFKLAVLSLFALVFARPIGFSTANADERPLDEMTVPELKDLAASRNVELASDAKKADIIAALSGPPLPEKIAAAVRGEPVEDNRPLGEQIADLKAQLASVRSALPVPPPPPVTPGSLDLLVKGAGVDVADVGWRIRAGLSQAQAVEVALQEKNETAARKESK